ncbi:MAG: sulfotransferase domain-containing protein [Gillisia sp.]
MIKKSNIPDFIIIGAAKCGTTTIANILNMHPRIVMAKPKEPNFFNPQGNFQKGRDWYYSCFGIKNNTLNKNVIYGEASTYYSMRTRYPDVAKTIRRAVPDCKLIYIVRDPVERMISHWRMIKRDWFEAPPFDQILDHNYLKKMVVDISKYWFQISVYRKLFNSKNILVLFLEDYVNNTKMELKKIYDFLELEKGIGFVGGAMKLSLILLRHQKAGHHFFWKLAGITIS